MKRNRLTLDRDGTGPPRFHTSEQIGPKRFMTPEGFLLCMDVAIARTGWMVYAPRETPVPIGPDGYVMINRDAATLFAPSVFSSFAGKPVTNDHPLNGVDSSNWKNVAVGTVHNPRQGAGADSDVLLADLLITDAKAIKAVQAGKVEVSAGYEATYETTGVGEGRQLNIIGNHIALVERGRCGPRCAIGDRQPTIATTAKERSMSKQRNKVSDAVKELIANAHAALAEDPNEEVEDESNAVHVHVHTGDGKPKAEGTVDATEERFQKIEGMLSKVSDSLEKLAASGAPIVKVTADEEVEDTEGKGKSGDSSALETGYKAVMADAEVLVPGITMPAFVATAARSVTVDAMCQTRRKALDAFYLTGDGKMTVDSVRGAQTLDTSAMTCVDVANAFKAAAGAKRMLNNRASVGDAAHIAQQTQAPKKMTVADLNAMHRKHYENQH